MAVAFWPFESFLRACQTGGLPAGALLSWIAVIGAGPTPQSSSESRVSLCTSDPPVLME